MEEEHTIPELLAENEELKKSIEKYKEEVKRLNERFENQLE